MSAPGWLTVVDRSRSAEVVIGSVSSDVAAVLR